MWHVPSCPDAGGCRRTVLTSQAVSGQGVTIHGLLDLHAPCNGMSTKGDGFADVALPWYIPNLCERVSCGRYMLRMEPDLAIGKRKTFG
ncbi:MAG: hypothetical protein OXR07_00845 [Nitrospira sp.]|nr:hypothetical protein [Nitrospira sp.]